MLGSRETPCFPTICGSGGSKSRLAREAGAEPSGQMKHTILHGVVNPFWQFRARKMTRRCGAKHISTSYMQNKLTVWDQFWKFWCAKKARRCGGKRISKSRYGKGMNGLGPLRRDIEVEDSARCCGTKHISKSRY